MGFMNWLMNGVGFESDESYNNPEDKQKAYEEKLRIKEEKRLRKLEKKNQKAQARVKNQPSGQMENSNSNNMNNVNKSNNADTYLQNPDQYNTSKYDKPMNDYGVNTSNVGGYGTKNVEFVNPTKYDDVKIVINYLRDGESIMLNLNRMGDDSQRLLDCVAGAVYALNGNLRRVDSNIFLITPEGFNIRVQENHDM